MRATTRNAPLRPTRRRRVVSVRAAARTLRLPPQDVAKAAARGDLPSLVHRGQILIDLGKVLSMVNPPARGRFTTLARARGRA